MISLIKTESMNESYLSAKKVKTVICSWIHFLNFKRYRIKI